MLHIHIQHFNRHSHCCAVAVAVLTYTYAHIGDSEFAGSWFNSILVKHNCFGQLLCCKGTFTADQLLGPYTDYIANGKDWGDVECCARRRLCLRDVRCCSLHVHRPTMYMHILHFTAERGSAWTIEDVTSHLGAKPDIVTINPPIYLSRALIKYLLLLWSTSSHPHSLITHKVLNGQTRTTDCVHIPGSLSLIVINDTLEGPISTTLGWSVESIITLKSSDSSVVLSSMVDTIKVADISPAVKVTVYGPSS